MVVVDSDVLIWVLQGRSEIRDRSKKLVVETNGFVFLTPIQIAEILAGARKKEAAITGEFLDSLSCLEITRDTGKLAGDFINTYAKSHKITIADAIIAATTRINSCKLWTLNSKHYPMFKRVDFVV